jgi:hypothetical protein
VRRCWLLAAALLISYITLKIPGTNEMGNTYKNLDHKNKNTVTQISFKSSILCIAGMTLNDK